jgi:hypothetical protein
LRIDSDCMKLPTVLFVLLVASVYCVSGTGVRVVISNTFLTKLIANPLVQGVLLKPLLASLKINLPDVNITDSNYTVSFSHVKFNNSAATIGVDLLEGGIRINFTHFVAPVQWTLTWKVGSTVGSLTNSTNIYFDASIVNALTNVKGKPSISITRFDIFNYRVEQKNYTLPKALQQLPYQVFSNVLVNHTDWISSGFLTSLNSLIDQQWANVFIYNFMYNVTVPPVHLNVSLNYELSEDPVINTNYLSIGIKGDIGLADTPCSIDFKFPPVNQTHDLQVYISRTPFLCLLKNIQQSHSLTDIADIFFDDRILIPNYFFYGGRFVCIINFPSLCRHKNRSFPRGIPTPKFTKAQHHDLPHEPLSRC